MKVITGDCVEVMKRMPEASVDSIICDPPYGLSKEPDIAEVLKHWLAGDDYEHRGGGFMGKTWDSFVPGPSMWREALRVLKPGGYLLCFAGTRTSDLMGVSIRLAGFEIRDTIAWQHMEPVFCRCDPLPYNHEELSHQDLHDMRKGVATNNALSGNSQPDVRPEVCGFGDEPREGRQASAESSQANDLDMPGVRRSIRDPHMPSGADRNADVLATLQRQAASTGVGGSLGEHEGAQAQGSEVRREQPGLEGRCDLSSQSRQPQGSEVRPLSTVGPSDGAQGRLCDGASTGDGEDVRPTTDADRGGASLRSQLTQQCGSQSGAMAVEWITQGGGAWPGCPRCSKPLAPPFSGGPLVWNYGQGFPKSLNVSKAIDKAAGAVATPEAEQWEGWGTALKPAMEPIIVARKSLGEKTVAANVLTHGTGALNIDACRIGTTKNVPASISRHTASDVGVYEGNRDGSWGNEQGGSGSGHDPNTGRWPANVVMDPEAGAMLDQQTGTSTSRVGQPRSGANGDGWGMTATGAEYSDSGGASRFFYCAKTSSAEREAGLREAGLREAFAPTMGNGIGGKEHDPETATKKRNKHPTVKPISLMRWLVRLVTPPGGRVLDPFAGSGSTGCACVLEGFVFGGIEQDSEYVEIAKARIAHWASTVNHEGEPQ